MTQYTSLFKAAEALGIPHNQLSEALAPREQWLKQEARREVVEELFEEIEAMYPELGSVYWRGKDWLDFKAKYLEGK